MIRQFLFFLLPPFLLANIFFHSGCISLTRVKRSTLVEPKTDTLVQDTLVKKKTPSKLITKKPEIDTLALIDSLVQSAHSCLAKADMPQAHRAFLEAIHLIEQKNDSLEDISGDFADRLYQIVELYLTALPKEYLDSLPQHLNSLVFRYQISMAIDTLSLSPDDSGILLGLDCEEGIPYNVPIVHNKRVQNALYVIVSRRSKSLERVLTRANYYLPVMQSMFTEHDMPTDLCYLPILESAFKPKAYSYAHASGIWQFIPSTGRIYGLRNNYWVDERRDPLKSTFAAILYLKKLHGDFNDWYLALAGYNCGERNVERAIKKAQSTDYWQLKLPRQTMNYVPLYISYQVIAKNPQCFGFKADTLDTFNLDTVHISDCLDLHKIAEGLNIPYAELKKINPHIKRWCTPPDMDDIALYLPFGQADTFKAFYETLSEDDKVRWYRYRIKSGDNLLSISRRYKISVPALRSINKLRSNFIVAGRYLYIPLPSKGSKPSKSFNDGDVNAVAEKKKAQPPEIAEFKAKGLKPLTYKVKSGETISQIADRYKINSRKICRWNNISNPRKVQAGTRLKLYISEENTPSAQTVKSTAKPPPGYQKNIYTVKSGDNLYAVSRKVRANVNDLAQWNNLDMTSQVIKPGEKLVYYSSPQVAISFHQPAAEKSNTFLYTIKKGDTFYSLARRYSVDLERLFSVNKMNRQSIIKPGDTIQIPKNIENNGKSDPSDERIIYYKVKKGDNLWSIAKQYGISISKLFELNNLTKKSVILPGKILKILLSEDL